MPKTQIVSEKIRQPSGHFSQAAMIEARGRLVFISGMTALRRRQDCRHWRYRSADPTGLRERQIRCRASRRDNGRYLPGRCLCSQHGALRSHPQSTARYFKPPAPASTMVEVCKMTSPDYLIEMSAIAVV